MIDIKKYAAYYWLGKISGGKRAVQDDLMSFYGSAEEIWAAGQRGEIDCKIPGEKDGLTVTSEDIMNRAVEIMKRVSKDGTGVVSRYDDDYPSLLRECDGSPLLLFYDGDIKGVNRARSRLAVVGSRRCTTYGREMCGKLVSSLEERDVCIVSGLARGIDSYAHKAALEAGMFTAAVLGCGTNVIYPGENAGLFAKIRENGVIISEQPPDTQPFKSYFPARNRIIAGCSEAALVIEAGLSSGALITANFSLNFGREVLTIPHRIDMPEGAGCNDLIKTGAVMVTSPADILEPLGFDCENAREKADMLPEALDRNQREVLYLIKTNGELFEDEIACETDMSSQELKRALSALEIFGFVKKDFAGKYYAA